ncbi:formate dehydrogenase, partial [bacterium]|nr:formate dehydrogenase [bacterium]
WIAFRQPVLREAARRMGKRVAFTYEVNPGEVWEEDEFWIELSWRIDPDGSLGIKQHFISPYRAGEKITIDEYYQYIFEHTAGLPEKAAAEGLTALDYMRKYGAFEVEQTSYNKHLKELGSEELKGTKVDDKSSVIYKNGGPIGVMVNGKAFAGFATPSRKQEFFSQTLVDWGWPEYRIPVYIKSHVHPEKIHFEAGEFPLVPTFRLPTLIHTRSGNAKWLMEISNRNPVLMHTKDARGLGLKNGDLVRVTTEIGYFVDRVWVTEGMMPGVVACSHHLGRWRRKQDPPANRWATNLVSIQQQETGKWKMSCRNGIRPYKSTDADSARIFWSDGGVHQNITFPVHPDPISGMHCWHQKVKIEKAQTNDHYGDVIVDTEKSFQIYKEWLKMARPAPGPNGLRRPLWLNRPLRPAEEMFYIKE